MSARLRAEAEAKYPNIMADGKQDYKAWARRFIYRAERGDKDLLPIQIQFAYAAFELTVPKVDIK